MKIKISKNDNEFNASVVVQKQQYVASGTTKEKAIFNLYKLLGKLEKKHYEIARELNNAYVEAFHLYIDNNEKRNRN